VIRLTYIAGVSKPPIQIQNPRVVNDEVHFEAAIAGHVVQLRMTQEFVEDSIGRSDDASVRKYLADNATGIEEAARVRAYEHATRGKKPGDPPGAVPYASFAKEPFTQIQIRPD